MKNYYLEYELKGVQHSQNLDAVTPGQAQAKLIKMLPGAKVTRCLWEGHLGGNTQMPIGYIEYEIASTAAVTPLEAEEPREQVAFGFLAKIKPAKRKR